jgi:hypothetical protein
VLLGLLFIFLTYRRDIMHRKCDSRLDRVLTFPILLHYMPRNINQVWFSLTLFAYSNFVFSFCPVTAVLCIIQANGEIPYVLFNFIVSVFPPVFYK